MRLISLCTILSVLVVSPLMADPPSMDAVRQAVVHLPGGSGVCVSPDGWIVTAAHMLPGWPICSQDGPQAPRRQRLFHRLQHQPLPTRKPPQSVQVRFDGTSQSLVAKVLAVRSIDMKSDIAILKVEGSQFPFRPMSGRSPQIGELCYHAGWPGPQSNWYWQETHVIKIGEDSVIDVNPQNGIKTQEVIDMTTCSHGCLPGASGGPLLNARFEVIGTCSRTTSPPVQMTSFARWEHVTACLIESGYSPLTSELSRRNGELTLQVWSTPTCTPCLQFKADLARGIDCNGLPLQQAFHLEFYDYNENIVLAQRIGVKVVPTFVTGDGELIEGYETAGQLARQLTRYQFPKPQEAVPPPVVIGNPGAGPVVPPPIAQPPAVPPEDKPIDPADLRIVVLIEKQGLGSWSLIKGIALSKAEAALERKAPSIAKEKFGDRLAISVCCERLHPDKFAGLINASGVTEAKFTLLVLVKKRFEGLKERLASFVESKAKDFGPIGNQTARVELIFERTDDETYDAVVDALDLEEDHTEEILGTAAVTGTAAGGWTGWLSRRRRLLRRGHPVPPEESV